MTAKQHIFLSLVTPVLVGVFFLWPSVVSAKTWSIENWDTDITVNEDGTFLVQEERTFHFQDDFSWIEVVVEKDRITDITDFQVIDPTGRPLSDGELTITNTDQAVTARIDFSAHNERKTWVFSYRVVGGIGFFEKYDELYWDVLPADHPVDVGRFMATVHLPRPAEFLDRFDQVMYVGGDGSTDKSDQIEIVDNQTIVFRGEAIPANIGLTLVASWAKGIVDDPGTLLIKARNRDREISGATIWVNGNTSGVKTPHAFQITDPAADQQVIMVKLEKFGYQSATRQLTLVRGRTETFIFELTAAWWLGPLRTAGAIAMVLAWLSPFAVFMKLFRNWKKFGQDPKFRKTIVPEYEPPSGLAPSEMGTLMDERVDVHDVTCAIVHLAVLGHLVIREAPPHGFSSKQQNFILERRESESIALPHYERGLLKLLFARGDTINMQKDFRTQVYPEMEKIRQAIYQSMVAKGYFNVSPEFVRRSYLRWPIIWLVVLLGGGFVFAIVSPWTLTVTVPLLLADIVALIFAGLMPKRTLKGVEARWLSLGFQKYLTVAERFRLGDVNPETFDRYLPYAMVLGVDKKWAARFANVYTQPPGWYQGSSLAVFSLSQLTHQLSEFSNVTSAAIAPSTSSSHSGFSGGSVGGGGGGGSVSAG